VAARVRCITGANQMLPSSMAAFRGWMSISVNQPDTMPVAMGRTAQAIGSWVVEKSATVLDAITAITEHHTGLAVVVDEAGQMVGVFSDGDFRRLALKSKNPLSEKVLPYIVRQPKTIQQGVLAVEALRKFEEYKINQLVVLDDFNFPVGVVDAQDLPNLKLV